MSKQRNATWSLGKNGNCIVSDKLDGIMFPSAGYEDSIEHYGGILVCESIQTEVAEMIIKDHELIKKLSVIDESDRDNLCDMLWWLKGYKNGANDNFSECPFEEQHLRSLQEVVSRLRDLLNAISDKS